ncbi:hypothetical protein BDZ97DRAFT_1752689 [Flammula alnicola]|nr:hypothetical protein BDZ97DRAFT_1752689 [Flammula alnicola]
MPSLPVPADTQVRSWQGAVKNLTKIWALVCKGGVVLLPMSLTLLQFGGTKSTLARTLTIAACVCAGGAFILSAIFISMRSRLSRGSVGNLWAEASPTLSSPGALTFWVTLVSPMSYIIWSLLFCVLTVLVVSWNKDVGGTTPDVGNSTDAKAAFIGPLSRFAEPLLSSEGGNAIHEAAVPNSVDVPFDGSLTSVFRVLYIGLFSYVKHPAEIGKKGAELDERAISSRDIAFQGAFTLKIGSSVLREN